MNEWLKTDPAFANFHYLGKHRPTITLTEFAEMKERVSANPLEVKTYIRFDLSEKRTAIGKKSVAKTTFYRGIGQATLSQFCTDTPYQWFDRKGIKIPPNYPGEDARKSLSEIFTFSGSKKTFRHISSSKYRPLSWLNVQTFLLTNSPIDGEEYIFLKF